jgi:hypothetical protein
LSLPPPHVLAERPTNAIAAAAATIINFLIVNLLCGLASYPEAGVM